jgi:DNA-binding MarR family transcriptional regulator
MANDPPLGELLGRELSTAVVLFHQAIAERVGLNATDLKCLDLLARTGPITAGRLSELAGLTSGAITGIIDHLEAAGYVQRERDRSDRRRVIIKPSLGQEYANTIAPIFASLQQAMGEELAQRYSPEVLGAIEDFLRRTIQVLRQETQKLQKAPGEQPKSSVE